MITQLSGGRSGSSRREFLRHLASATALAAVMSPLVHASAAGNQQMAAPKKTLVGSNIYGWGQYAQRDKRQLEVEEVLAALRDAGYDYLENFMNVDQPEANARFADQLKAKGMQPVSLYVG
ncbi:MAG TPA: twin-arginine translocation signal domain-containing protein, partial [Bacillota bacterium]|nr:twin-arginine translocation signal domain-containing protein [Bacillota bacterium]